MNLSIHFLKVFSKIVFLLTLALFLSCKESQLSYTNTTETDPLKPKQGVSGQVIYKEGTFDANGNLISRNGIAIGVSRQVYFYELTGLKEAEMGDGSFIKMIHTDIIDSAKSDKDGRFLKALKPGNYTVVVKENERLFCPVNDEGIFCPVTVFKDSVTAIMLNIDYNAKYSE